MIDKKIPNEHALEKPTNPPKPMETCVREMNEKLQILAKECQLDGNFLIGAWALESKTSGEVRIGFIGLAKQLAQKWSYALLVWQKLISAVTLEDIKIAKHE